MAANWICEVRRLLYPLLLILAEIDYGMEGGEKHKNTSTWTMTSSLMIQYFHWTQNDTELPEGTDDSMIPQIK